MVYGISDEKVSSGSADDFSTCVVEVSSGSEEDNNDDDDTSRTYPFG